MKLTEDKLRRIIQEELRFKGSGNKPPRGSANSYLQRFLKEVFQKLATQLQSSYDIEFTDVIEARLALSADFEVYNRRQDVFYDGEMHVFVYDDDVVSIEVNAGPKGSSISEMSEVISRDFGFNDQIVSQVNIVSAMQTVAGRP
jgi:hypothetical protein